MSDHDLAPSGLSDNGNMRIVLNRMDLLAAAVGEIKGIMQSFDTRLRQLELERVGSTATLDAKITAAHNRLDSLAEKTTANTADIRSLTVSQQYTDQQLARYADGWRVLTWIGSAVGVALIGLIIAVITGQVQLVFTP